MAIFFVLMSGAFVAFSNLMMRKSVDCGGSAKGYMAYMMLTSFASAVLLEPVRTGNYAWNGPVLILGALGGIVMAVMLYCLGRAVEAGPPGLTFSLLASSTVMPAILMAFMFGSNYGFPYTSWHAIGSLLVVAGIFWAGKETSSLQGRKQWILFCFSMFSLHVALLVLFQWRSLLQNLANPQEISPFFTTEDIKSAWFLPSMFLTSCIIQVLIFLRAEKRWPYPKEALFGVLGGLLNGSGTFFLICATSIANPLENAIIFPMYSVAIIVLSNLWGERLYSEKVNWRACQLSALGLIIASVDWKGLISAFF